MKFAYELLEKFVEGVKDLEKQGILKVRYRSIEVDEENKEIALHIALRFSEESWSLLYSERKEEKKPEVVKLEFKEEVKTREQVQK